ncbi:MAG: hypothetical protein QMC83_09500 [Thermodesulfovibrionales bacterium]|nr:hypothetical protein [Thermodesulfovibrionales bacterium]
MRKYFLLPVILMILSLHKDSYGFDITGLQPTPPYGVFSTFSAESLPKGKVAFSTDAEILIEPDFYRFFFKTAYGITDAVEFNMTIPYIHKWADSVDGFEDIALGLKHRFFDEGKYGLSIAYILNASIPSGRDEFSTDGRFGGGLIVSKRVGPVKGHINFFYEEPGKGSLDEEIILGAGLDFAAAHNVKILAELYSKKSHDSKEFDSLEGRVGYRIKTTDLIYTTLGAGFDLKNRGPEYRIMFSVTFLLPSEKKTIKRVYEEE